MAVDEVPDSDLVVRAPAVPGSVPVLRRWTVESARALGAGPEALDAIELAASEVITNAVRHAAGTTAVTVRVSTDGAHVRCEVQDDDPTLPRLRADRQGLPGGHGLHLLGVLSAAWGARPEGAGKVVWFTVAR